MTLDGITNNKQSSPTNRDTAVSASFAKPTRLLLALQLCLLLIIAATALAYPLCLSESWIIDSFARLSSNKEFRFQLMPWISCGFTPLILKESFLLTGTLVLLFLFAWIKIRGQWLGTERSALMELGGFRGLVRKPETWMFAFLLYSAASILWSPVPQQSMQTWVLMASGIAIALTVRSENLSRGLPLRFMALIVLLGTVLAVLALLQHLGLAFFLPQHADPRNRMSSLIGHNTGLSAWLLFPLSFSLYFAFTNRRTWLRIVAIAIALLTVVVIVAAQSRAIWGLSIGLVVILIVQMARVQGKRLRLSVGLLTIGSLLAIVAALSVSPQTNPLARLPVSLEQRVIGDILNPDQLRKETRLRILAVSLTEMFPKAPILGTGIGSFGWEYPRAQGTYFADHPNTSLGTTTRRTDLAHNDYLQVLTETGLIGLLLLVGGLLAFFREAILVYRNLPTPWLKTKWWALTLPTAGVLIQALVDFPFHIAPIAAVTLLSGCLATRLAPGPAESDQAAEILSAPPRNATIISLIATTVIFAWSPWGWQALVGRALVSDVYYNIGLKELNEFHEEESIPIDVQLIRLDRARKAFREAIISNVFNGEAYEGQSTAYVNRANLALTRYLELKTSPDDTATTMTPLLKGLIENDVGAAVQVIDNQLRSGGLRYHFTYYLLGRAWRIRWELDKAERDLLPENSPDYRKAVEALRTALRYNPADSASIRELADLLSINPKTAEASRRLQAQLFQHDPWSADQFLLQPPLKLAAQGEIHTAKEMLSGYFTHYANYPNVKKAQAWLAYYEAVWPPETLDELGREDEYLVWRQQHLDAAWDTLSSLPEDAQTLPIKRRLILLYVAASGDLKQANALAKAALKRNQWDREARAITYWTEKELHGGGLKYEDTIQYYRTKALLSLYFMTDREAGLALGELAFREKLRLPEARRLVAFCKANNFNEVLKKVLPQIRRFYPADPTFHRLAKKLG